MSDFKGSYIGKSLKRKHDIKFITGKATYINDLNLPGMLHLAYLGSPYAHARIISLDFREALKLKGVRMVLTGEDCVKHLNPLPVTVGDYSQPPYNWHWRTVKAYPLAVGKVRYVGEPVAAVVAEDPYTAEDALDLINVEYEPLPVVTNVEEALKKDAPLLYEEWGDNIQAHTLIKGGDIDQAFREADRIVKFRTRTARQSGFPLETRGCLSVYDSKTETLTHYNNTQSPIMARYYLAKTLGIPENKIRVIATDIGGGFGNKINWSKEVIPALASKLTGRPVKWFEKRTENFLTQPHARDNIWEAELAVKNDGTIIGYKAKLIVDLGVEGTNRAGGAIAPLVGASNSAGPLKHLKGAQVEVFTVVTNKAFYTPYRGMGREMSIRFYGRAFYAVSRELKIPVEKIIERNVLRKEDYPFRTILGSYYDSGDFQLLLDKAIKKYVELQGKKRELISKGKLAGVGITPWVEPAGASVWGIYGAGIETARVSISLEGKVTVYTSITDIGQGTESTMAQIVADILGVKIDDIVVVEGDSEIMGGGAWADRGSVYGASAVAKASKILRERVLKTVAHVWDAKPEDLDIKDSEVYKKDEPSKRISIYEVAKRVYYWPGAKFVMPQDLLEKGETTLDVAVSWFSPLTAKHHGAVYTTHATGIDVALVEIDPETCFVKVVDYYVVHDVGTIINPAVVEGQLIGGIAQGIGEALYEELVYDENGQLLNPTYGTYYVPTSTQMPNIEIDHIENPSPYTELGTKGVGEGGIISAPATIMAAIEDALSQYGVVIEDIPITPDRLRRLLKA